MVIRAQLRFILFFSLLLFGLSCVSCGSRDGSETVERLRIGVYPDSISALVYIAEQQGMFKRHGLDVSLESYQTGAYAVTDLLAGKVDVATAAEFVLVLQGFKRQDLRVVGTISSTEINEVVARRDRGIMKPEDLRGKTIGVTKGTIAEFFLSAFLCFNGILPRETRVVDLSPSEMVAALSDGAIDAAGFFPPFADAMKRNLAQNAISWPAQGGQAFYLLLITTEGLIRTKPRIFTGILKGLLEAEAFLINHEKDSQNIVEHTLGSEHGAVLKTWSKTRFRVRLDQGLLTLMEDEARWALQNKVVDAERIPNYLPLLYLEALGRIRPEAVGVVH
jgi:ABC-type nitrate/sulfonate/bicarbonate transport system substrate-binding protein